MKLASFSVSNFRSITSAKKVPLSDYSVLVGANNEGKSNILHALALGMEAIENFKFTIRRTSSGSVVRVSQTSMIGRVSYNWSHDFPMSKQRQANPDAHTEITLEFLLSPDEIQDFQHQIGSKLNGTLPVVIRFLRNGGYDVSISKQGPGATAMTRKANQVAEFISKRVNFDYIPAIRTSESAERVISGLVAKELARLDSDPEYQEAIRKINQLQEPILESLSEAIKQTVASFLPSVKSVQVRMPQDARYRALRQGVDIEIDDGDKTPLERKGDGVKSLVALALMRHASTVSGGAGANVIAIEEPEAHLHPQAIHELREVLVALSSGNQVIVTSHSPLFVNPSRLESTIIVQGSKAAPAKSIAQVRNVLGVRLSDNLQSARLVAIVEGSDDIITLSAILQHRYPDLRGSISGGDLVFDDLGGASNLSYKVRTYRSSASAVHCFLDSDSAGRNALKKAQDDGIIRVSDYNMITVQGLAEAELEDLLDPRAYKDAFYEHFGVDPTVKPPSAAGKKWSDAMKSKFVAHGKIWDAHLEMNVKLWVANFAAQHMDSVILESRFAPIDAFAKSLIAKLRS